MMLNQHVKYSILTIKLRNYSIDVYESLCHVNENIYGFEL